jgi:hypothetical protein
MMRTRFGAAAGGLIGLMTSTLVLAGPRRGALAATRDPTTWARQAGPDAVALTVAGALCWIVLFWLALGLVLMAATAAPGAVGRLAEAAVSRALPGSVRRVAAGLLGLTLTASVAACGNPTSQAATLGPGPPAAGDHPLPRPTTGSGDIVDWPLSGPSSSTPGQPGATADPGDGSPRGRHGTPTSGRGEPAGGASRPAGGPEGPPRGSTRSGSAGRPASEPARPAGDHDRPAAGTPTEPHDPVVVDAGDCLWLIAARRLDDGATSAQVTAETRRWYAANRAVIGADPDLLRPGQVLVPPRELRP